MKNLFLAAICSFLCLTQLSAQQVKASPKLKAILEKSSDYQFIEKSMEGILCEVLAVINSGENVNEDKQKQLIEAKLAKIVTPIVPRMKSMLSKDIGLDSKTLKELSDGNSFILSFVIYMSMRSDANFCDGTGLQKAQRVRRNVDMNQVWGCLGEAIGLGTVAQILTDRTLTMVAVRRLAVETIKRYAGWVGAAVMLYSFGSCMTR